MTTNEFSKRIRILNRVAIYVVTYILCAKILEFILRSLNQRVLAFFPGISIEIALYLIDIFLIPYIGVYAILIICILASKHSN